VIDSKSVQRNIEEANRVVAASRAARCAALTAEPDPPQARRRFFNGLADWRAAKAGVEPQAPEAPQPAPDMSPAGIARRAREAADLGYRRQRKNPDELAVTAGARDFTDWKQRRDAHRQDARLEGGEAA